MRRNGAFGLAAIAAVAGCLAAAGPAAATIAVSSTGTALTIEDENGTFNDNVRLSLVLGSLGPEWRIFKSNICGFTCIDLKRFNIGAGCRATGDDSVIACDRLGKKVSVLLRGGDDSFSVDSAVPVTDPLEVNGQTGNDFLSGGAGADSLQGGSGDDAVFGNGGNDTLGGSIGNDNVFGGPGADTIDSGDGNDKIDPATGADTVDAGAGDDAIFLGTAAEDERDVVQGGLGNDFVTYGPTDALGGIPGRSTAVRVVEANLETLAGDKDFSEGDVLRSIERYSGGLGEDILTGVLSSNASDYFGDLDDDTIFGSSGDNTLVGGRGDDQLSGKDGNDILDAKSGEISKAAHTDFAIDCGAGAGDLAILDLTDDSTPTGCEGIQRSALQEGPHVRPSVPRLARVVAGAVGVRLACPRALKRPCAGTLRLQIARASSARSSYSISPGRSRRVSVRLAGLASRVGTRTKAALISVERGIHGAKTTEKPIVLSGRSG